MPLILGTNSVKGGYEVANSCRFDNDSSDYLTFTPSSNGSRRIFTISFWFKTTSVAGGNSYMFSTGNYSGGDGFLQIKLSSSGRLTVDDYDQNGDSYNLRWTTPSTILFRDPAAWYHFVLAVDSTQGTQSNRAKVYINGVDISSSFTQTTSPSQNDDFHVNTSSQIEQIGRSQNNNSYYDGYLAEFVMIDGSALAPTSFGEFDEDTPTIWKPISVSGLTFGTNGFYLDFETDDTLGNDVSGNDNDFANSNLTSVDQSTDTCTNNFATMNPLAMGSNITISEGNLKVSNGSSDNSVLGTIGLANGKFYWEAKCTGATTYANIGVTLASAVGVTHSNVDAGRIVYSHNGYVYKEGLSGQSNVSGLATFTTNDIISVAFDAQNGSVKFYKNGTLVNTTTDNDLLFSNNEYITSIGMNQGGFELNFGSPPYSISSGNSDANGFGNFEYAVPSGYFALCTKNLAEHG